MQVSLWFFPKRHFIEFSKRDFWELATEAPRRATWLLGWHSKKAQGEEGMSESSSKLPFPHLQHKSESSRELFPGCSSAGRDWFQAAGCSRGLVLCTGQLRRDRDSPLLPGLGRELNVWYWLDTEHEQQSNFGFSPLLPSLLPCSQRNMIKMWVV